MSKGSQVAVALGAGYLLGRNRKMRLTMLLAAAAAAGGASGIAGQAIRRGAKAVGASLGSADLLGKLSPELGELGGILRDDLLDAGKGAARTAVNSRMDSLSEKLHERAESWRNPADAARGAVGAGQDAVGAGQDEEPEDAGDEAGREEKPKASPRPRRSTRRASGGRGDEDVTRPARRSTRTARSAESASPVRRTRR